MIRRQRQYRRKRVPSKYMLDKNKRNKYKMSRSIYPKQNVYHFKRYANIGTLVVGNLAPVFNAFVFQLDQVPAETDFTNLFDSYRINGVKITFRPQQTESISIGSINNPSAYARFVSAIDYNDSIGISSVDELREYQSCKCTSILEVHERYIHHPRIQDRGQTYTPGRPWINCSSPTQEHYGLKVAVEPINSTSTTEMTYSVEAVFYMSFKYVK